MRWKKDKDRWYVDVIDADCIPIYEAEITKFYDKYRLEIRVTGYKEMPRTTYYSDINEAKRYFEQYLKETIEHFTTCLGRVKNDDRLKEIADYYGLEGQELKLIEEMAELTQAIIKGKHDHVSEEIADVEIMLEQVKYLGHYHPEAYREFKIARQLKRMERNEEHNA